MTESTKTWSVLLLVLAIIIIVLLLMRKKQPTTNTSVNVSGNVTQFPTRDVNNSQLLRICTYSNGETLSLDPGAVGGHCPPVYTDIAGNSGILTKDEIITLPQAGTFSATPGGA